MAGVDRHDDAGTIRAVMRRLGFRDHTIIVNDALVALVAGAAQPFGVVIVSGTGSIAYGVNAAGHAARSGGWGPVLADEGSGYWVGRRALAAVMRQADGRGPSTELTPLVLQHLDLSRPDDLVSEVYEGPERRRVVASLGPIVEQARASGDPVAGEILREASMELVTAASSVVRQLEMRGDLFPTVLAGGLFRSVPWLEADVVSRLREVAPRTTASLLTVEPAHGAVRLALAEAAGRSRLPVYVDRPSPDAP
jgi:N-acetylglucosamine kinase-like BadF-type ATPase